MNIGQGGIASSKSIVKAAREAIDREDHATALRLCSTGLEEDPACYMLWILKGLASKECGAETISVANFYQQAIALQPEQPVAWQVNNSNR